MCYCKEGQAHKPYHMESEAHMPPAEVAAAEAACMRRCCAASRRASSSRAKYSTSAGVARPPLLRTLLKVLPAPPPAPAA